MLKNKKDGRGIRCSTDYAFDYAAARSQQLLLSSSTVHKFLDSVNPECDVTVCVPILVLGLVSYIQSLRLSLSTDKSGYRS